MRCLVGASTLSCALAALGCHDVAPTRQAIVGGMPSGEASVVYTVQTGSTVLCAGTVVGPRDVLTVQRCVTPAGSDTPIPPGAINVGVGASVDTPERTVAVEEVILDGGTDPEDLALLRTVTAIGLPAAPLPAAAPTGGQTVVIVGYGRTDAAMPGIRHEGDATIASVGAGTFDAMGPAFGCGEGDDGGPALSLSGEVVGVGALADTTDCPPTTNTYRTVFDGIRFIEDNLAPPLPDAGAPPDVDAGPATDAGAADDAGDGRTIPDDGGCAVSRRARHRGVIWTLALALALMARRRRGPSTQSAVAVEATRARRQRSMTRSR